MFDTNCLVFLAVEPEYKLINILHVSKQIHNLGWRTCIQQLHHRKLESRSILCCWIYACCCTGRLKYRRLRAQHCQFSTPFLSRRSKQQSSEHSSLIPVMIFDTRLGSNSFSPKAQRPGMTGFPALWWKVRTKKVHFWTVRVCVRCGRISARV